ncbi:hypothetical protein GQ44DRAFT_824375 [Phaeosphaeriaceae sp. PMI808]|nr:hypothetical protein GQ44DRAFT_824375 [Phaeosphaeriaceae sp. PMI808]
MTTTEKQDARVAPITRSLILQHLWSPGRYENAKQTWFPNGTDHSEIVDCVINIESKNSFLSVDNNLEDMRAWLDTQCDVEKAQVDWSPDYEREINTTAEGLNTSALERIRRGHGPRSSRFEDLLWPLRIRNPPNSSPRFSKRPRSETYSSMQEVLLTWNKHVASADDNFTAREVSIEAMHGRIAFLNMALSHRRSADAHDDSLRKLLHCIHAYHPETASFKTKDPFDLITILLAHIGFSVPDVDDDLKYIMFYTLVAERVNAAHIANAGTRHMLSQNVAIAKANKQAGRAWKYERALNEWVRSEFERNCNMIAEEVKVARQNVHLKALKDLQNLVVLQIAQKTVLRDKIAGEKLLSDNLNSASAWLKTGQEIWDSATTHLENMVEYLDELSATCNVAASSSEGMASINQALVLTRAMEFVGLDLKHASDAERQLVVAERMANPSTIVMMGSTIEGITETRIKARELFESLGKMDSKLAELMEATEAVLQQYEGLARLVDSDSIPFLESDFDSEGEEYVPLLIQERPELG